MTDNRTAKAQVSAVVHQVTKCLMEAVREWEHGEHGQGNGPKSALSSKTMGANSQNHVRQNGGQNKNPRVKRYSKLTFPTGVV